MSSTLRVSFRASFLLSSLLLLGVLSLIALYVRDAFVRPFLGDVLSVVWLYLTLRVLVQGPPRLLAAGCVALACLVELGQWANLSTHLGVQDHEVWGTVLGATFDPLDLLAYAVGGACVVVGHEVWGRWWPQDA